MLMTTFQAIYLMIAFGMFILAYKTEVDFP
ncbi:putative holin-like toxin [Bacillus changyiensis]|nr:putative holin-like toxin [Bacillus changyiensis]MDA1476180.1 putative holin-like toxin [Bacillus changyiensis]